MGKRSIRKGKRIEYLVRDRFRELGFECERVPCSGNSKAVKGDLLLSLNGRTLKVEVKARKKNGLKKLYDWLEGSDLLVVKIDRKEPLAVIPFSLLRYLLHGGEL